MWMRGPPGGRGPQAGAAWSSKDGMAAWASGGGGRVRLHQVPTSPPGSVLNSPQTAEAQMEMNPTYNFDGSFEFVNEASLPK